MEKKMKKSLMSLMMTTIATSLTSSLDAAPCWKDNGETRQLIECGQTQELQPNTDKQPLSLPFIKPAWCASENKTKLEELICFSPTLSELDIRFNQLYKSVPSESRPRGLVQDRNEKCHREKEEETQQKLKEWYESAISLLQQHTLSSQSLGTYSEISWCHKPNLSEPERIMCGLNGTNLGKLDSELNQRYHSLRMRNINEQKAWLRERDQALLNGNVSQVEELYKRRITELDK
jgi:uncharacterized protein